MTLSGGDAARRTKTTTGGESDFDGWAIVPKKGGGAAGPKKRLPLQNDQWVGKPLILEPIPQDSQNSQFRPFLLVLAGLPGSGKSTFARTLVEAMPYKFARVNQDEMKTRKRCVASAKQAMASGLCVIVDRCNFDFSQRQVWYDLAAEHHYPVDCLVLSVPLPICIQRCQQRPSHESIQPKEAPRIVNMVKAQWEMPRRDEQIKYLRTFRILTSSQQVNEAVVHYLNQK